MNLQFEYVHSINLRAGSKIIQLYALMSAMKE